MSPRVDPLTRAKEASNLAKSLCKKNWDKDFVEVEHLYTLAAEKPHYSAERLARAALGQARRYAWGWGTVGLGLDEEGRDATQIRLDQEAAAAWEEDQYNQPRKDESPGQAAYADLMAELAALGTDRLADLRGVERRRGQQIMHELAERLAERHALGLPAPLDGVLGAIQALSNLPKRQREAAIRQAELAL